MKHTAKVLAAALAVSAFLTGTVYAQNTDCRRKCNDEYAACQKSGKPEEKCRAAWVACKNKCPK